MEIKDEHLEFAVVERLGKLLATSDHNEFAVTETYAHFASVVCWIVQRLRENDKNLDRLSELITDEPWSIEVSKEDDDSQNIHFLGSSAKIKYAKGVDSRQVGPLMIGIRNAIAHGDHRSVFPLQKLKKVGKPNRNLIGFEFRCQKDNSDFANISLEAKAMKRVGSALIDRFMKLKNFNSHLIAESRSGVLEKVA